MNWQWVVFVICSYVAGAYILRSTMTPKDNTDYSGIAAAFLFSPLWAGVWVILFIFEKVFAGIGRWISG